MQQTLVIAGLCVTRMVEQKSPGIERWITKPMYPPVGQVGDIDRSKAEVEDFERCCLLLVALKL